MNLTALIFFAYISLILVSLIILNDVPSAIITMIIGAAMMALHKYGSDEFKNKFKDFYD